MSNMNNHPGLIYRGAPGQQSQKQHQSQPQAPQQGQKPPQNEKKSLSSGLGLVKKDIVIPENWANKAIKIGASGVIGVSIGFLLDKVIKNKPITWFLVGSMMALGFEFVKKD